MPCFQDLRDLHDFQGHVRTTYRSDPTAPPEEDDIWVEIKYKIVSTPCEESGFDDHYEVRGFRMFKSGIAV